MEYQESDDSLYEVEEEEHSDEEVAIDDRDFRKDDFVLVKFFTESKSQVHYIGQILAILDHQYNIKFLRRRGMSNIFSYPNIDDIQDVGVENITGKVKETISSGSKRMRNCFAFNILNFSCKSIC